MERLNGIDVWRLYELCKEAIQDAAGEETTCKYIGDKALHKFMAENSIEYIETKKMIKYVHGSGDSTDNDVIYVVDELPSKQDCKRFCSNQDNPDENRNICVIKNGEVVQCYKGTPDEVNNAVFLTYNLHKQEYPLLITHLVPRDAAAKCMRAVRIILSHLSRSQYRPQVKHALVSNFTTRLKTLEDINLETIDFDHLNNNMTREDILKTIAFQIGQTYLLLQGREAYTKASVAELFGCEDFLYRNKHSDVHELENLKKYFIKCLRHHIQMDERTDVISDGVYVWNVITETKVTERNIKSLWDKLYDYMEYLSREPSCTVEMDQELYNFAKSIGFVSSDGKIKFNTNTYLLG